MLPNKGIIELAMDEARQSPHRFKVGAVVYDRAYRIGWGHNEHRKTHPKSFHPFKSIHAEFAAIMHGIGTNGRDSVSNASIYVHRLKLDGSSGLAKPCEWCMKMLAQAGIRDIHWSLDGI